MADDDGRRRGRLPVMTPDARLNYTRVGHRVPRGRDLYLTLLTTPWPRLVALLAGAFCAANAIFAAGYLAQGQVIDHARPGSFADAFFFSVQTMATVGYGVMAPKTAGANVLVVLEVFVGLMGIAMVTGITFAKFSRPTARVLFSNVALITQRDGVPSLVFRMANERGSSLVEAQAHVVFSRNEVTREGESVRRFYDLALVRQQNVLFALSWVVTHPITGSSPLNGETSASLDASEAMITVSMLGLDETLGQTVHARHAYAAADLRWGARFVDVISVGANGERILDFTRFHEVVEPDAKPLSGYQANSCSFTR